MVASEGGVTPALFAKQNSNAAFEGLVVRSSAAGGEILAISYDGSVFNHTASYVGSGGYVPLAWSVGGSEAMRLTSTGLGIGTSSPGYRLDTLLGAGSGNIFRAGQSGVSNGYVITTSGSALTHIWANGGSDAMRLDSSGNLGLGVTPSAWGTGGNIQLSTLTFAGNDYSIGSNYYQNSGNKYIGNGPAALYSFYNGQHAWYTAPSGTAGNAITFTQAMTLDASGNLGIGTTSPSVRLNVTDSADGGNSGTIRLGSDATYYAQHQFRYNSSEYRFGTYGAGQFMSLYTAGSERARITSGGNFLINNTYTTASKLIVGGDGTSNAAYAGIFCDSGGANILSLRNDGYIDTGTRAVSPYNNTTGSAANMYVDSAGGLYRSTSSLRYKTDVQDATHGLAEVMQLRSVTYKGKNDGDTVFGGLIAEEVHAAGLTEFVQYAPDGSPDALAYGNMVSLCIKAIQEQQALITSLTARVALLEGN
jgi:hypothetical protein